MQKRACKLYLYKPCRPLAGLLLPVLPFLLLRIFLCQLSPFESLRKIQVPPAASHIHLKEERCCDRHVDLSYAASLLAASSFRSGTEWCTGNLERIPQLNGSSCAAGRSEACRRRENRAETEISRNLTIWKAMVKEVAFSISNGRY